MMQNVYKSQSAYKTDFTDSRSGCGYVYYIYEGDNIVLLGQETEGTNRMELEDSQELSAGMQETAAATTMADEADGEMHHAVTYCL